MHDLLADVLLGIHDKQLLVAVVRTAVDETTVVVGLDRVLEQGYF